MIKAKIVGDLENDPASRQSLIPGWKQEKIRKSRVLVVGFGALGNEVVKNLVLLGIGHIRIVDYDVVEGSNLSRAVFFRKRHAEKKVYKVMAAKETVKELDPYGYIEVEVYNDDIFKHNENSPLFDGIDVIFTALDSLEARLHVNSIAYFKKIPLIDGGMDGAMGHVQTVIPPYTSCLFCSVSERDLATLSKKFPCDGLPIGIGMPKVPAVITTTSIIAALMVHEFIKLIHGIEMFKKYGKWDEKIGNPLFSERIFINLNNHVFLKYKVPISKKCPLH